MTRAGACHAHVLNRRPTALHLQIGARVYPLLAARIDAESSIAQLYKQRPAQCAVSLRRILPSHINPHCSKARVASRRRKFNSIVFVQEERRVSSVGRRGMVVSGPRNARRCCRPSANRAISVFISDQPLAIEQAKGRHGLLVKRAAVDQQQCAHRPKVLRPSLQPHRRGENRHRLLRHTSPIIFDECSTRSNAAEQLKASLKCVDILGYSVVQRSLAHSQAQWCVPPALRGKITRQAKRGRPTLPAHRAKTRC